jgi:hypothetical protein
VTVLLICLGMNVINDGGRFKICEQFVSWSAKDDEDFLLLTVCLIKQVQSRVVSGPKLRIAPLFLP